MNYSDLIEPAKGLPSQNTSASIEKTSTIPVAEKKNNKRQFEE